MCVCVTTCIWVCGLICAHGCGCLQMSRPLRLMWGLFPDGCQWNSVLIVVHTCPLRRNDSIPLLFHLMSPSAIFHTSVFCHSHMFFPQRCRSFSAHTPTPAAPRTTTIHQIISTDIKMHSFTESFCECCYWIAHLPRDVIAYRRCDMISMRSQRRQTSPTPINQKLNYMHKYIREKVK